MKHMKWRENYQLHRFHYQPYIDYENEVKISHIWIKVLFNYLIKLKVIVGIHF